jgi:hypothetical protein
MDVGAHSARGSVRLILGCTLLALVLGGCASDRSSPAGGAASSAPHRTVTQTFSAYRADGQLAVMVGDVASGNCWTSSVAAPGTATYRCFAGNKILDPCFAPPRPTTPAEVACVAAPWSDAVVLHLTSPLPKTPGSTDVVRPWAFRLDNGIRCVASTGTVPAVHGVNLGYHCTDGHAASLRDATAPLVTADYGDPAAQTLQSVTVATIWAG